MRSAALIVLLVAFASCYTAPPPLAEPAPIPSVTPGGGGSLPTGNPPQRMGGTNCPEVSRVRCSADCRSGKSDLVTLRCSDGQHIYRCVANTGCPAK